MPIAAILIFIIGLAVVVFFVSKASQQMNAQLSLMNQQLNDRLRDSADTLLKTQQDMTQRLSKISEVEKSLTRMEQTYQHVLEVSKDIASLQDLLRAPKFRGGMGEFFLEDLLSQIMPSKNFYAVQYGFKNGMKADAVIKIGSNIVAIDAKFPLESFQRMIAAVDDAAQRAHRRQFVRDVQNRIDEIANKYIVPDEGTYDFALMYIPAENIYYETILKDLHDQEDKSVYTYALKKKVIPVSPHSLYPYLIVILRGLKGMAIEKNAKQVIEYLGRLQGDLSRFRDDFRLVGGHLHNARSKYEEAEKRLERFNEKFISAQSPTKSINHN